MWFVAVRGSATQSDCARQTVAGSHLAAVTAVLVSVFLGCKSLLFIQHLYLFVRSNVDTISPNQTQAEN